MSDFTFNETNLFFTTSVWTGLDNYGRVIFSNVYLPTLFFQMSQRQSILSIEQTTGRHGFMLLERELCVGRSYKLRGHIT